MLQSFKITLLASQLVELLHKDALLARVTGHDWQRLVTAYVADDHEMVSQLIKLITDDQRGDILLRDDDEGGLVISGYGCDVRIYMDGDSLIAEFDRLEDKNFTTYLLCHIVMQSPDAVLHSVWHLMYDEEEGALKKEVDIKLEGPDLARRALARHLYFTSQGPYPDIESRHGPLMPIMPLP